MGVGAMDKPVIIFWDIDGTLIDSAGAGVHAWVRGMVECFGLEGNIEGIKWAGRTDPFIGRLFFEKYGIEEMNSNFDYFLSRYVHYLDAELEKANGVVLPGVHALVEAVANHSGVQQALLTGNIAKGAEKKLRHYGLWHYFPFGSFADGIFDRNELSPIALQLARERVHPDLEGGDLVIIGDTPYDIQCGKVIGARTVGVATGHFTEDQLRAEKPDLVLPDFGQPDQLLKALDIR